MQDYKEAFNEWALEFREENDRDPSLEECEGFDEIWKDNQYEYANCYECEEYYGRK